MAFCMNIHGCQPHPKVAIHVVKQLKNDSFRQGLYPKKPQGTSSYTKAKENEDHFGEANFGSQKLRSSGRRTASLKILHICDSYLVQFLLQEFKMRQAFHKQSKKIIVFDCFQNITKGTLQNIYCKSLLILDTQDRKQRPLKVSKSQKQIMATWIFPKKRTLGQFSIHKIAPAFVFWKNPGQHIFFFEIF